LQDKAGRGGICAAGGDQLLAELGLSAIELIGGKQR
jgi:hypothetical protein